MRGYSCPKLAVVTGARGAQNLYPGIWMRLTTAAGRGPVLIPVLMVLLLSGACSSPASTSPAGPAATVPPTPTVPASLAAAVPSGAPEEDIAYFNEWPSPNDGLYNTRSAHSTISSSNVAKLRPAWTLPMTGLGATGRDFANPVIANGIVYLQDGASNVIAVSNATGKVLWTHMYNSLDYGPNGVTLAYGRVYGVTGSGVFALAAGTGRQVWYQTSFGAGKVRFDIAPEVANDRVFVASALTAGGGLIYALNAGTGALE
ncbi:MAG TPA: PQQ-binding-like beta-propeller repeat protein [Candidatus Dormibacteraeota bacterium]|nr:PQQ-binding-like beta-propeller repeat protein [Candidatus Dormibacteraeota bacterium]